jgi:hypothetical protein
LANNKIKKDNKKQRSSFFKQWKSFTLRVVRKNISLQETQKKRALEILANYFDKWHMKLNKLKSIANLSNLADNHFKMIQLEKVNF